MYFASQRLVGLGLCSSYGGLSLLVGFGGETDLRPTLFEYIVMCITCFSLLPVFLFSYLRLLILLCVFSDNS